MNYIIHTPSAARLKTEILDRVSEKAAVEREQSKDVLSYCRAEAGSALAKVDANGKGIVTWQVAETDSGEKVLVLLVHFSYFVDKIVIE